MKKVEELHPLKTPEGLWKEISINIIGPLPKSNGQDAIIVIMNQFTKMIHLKATITNVSSEDIMKIYWDEIWKLHKVPKAVLSDRGPQFASRFMEDLMKALGTKRMLSTAYLSRPLTVDFIYFYFFSFVLFFFSLLFYFLFLEQLRLGVISHAVTSVTTWWRSHKTDHGT